MDCWINTLSPCTLYFLIGWQVCFLLELFPDLMKAKSGQLAPFKGHGFVGMVCNELGLHRQLSNSDIPQFGVIWLRRGVTKGHNLVFGLYTSSSSIQCSYIKPTPLPLLLPPVYHPPNKSCQKQGIIWVSETCTPTQWLLIDTWIIGVNFICTALGTGKLPHNDYLKSPYPLTKLCLVKVLKVNGIV